MARVCPPFAIALIAAGVASAHSTFVVGALLPVSPASVDAPTPPNPVPLVNQPLVPDVARPGGGAFTLTVNGTGFVSGATVKWNGSPRSTTWVSESRLTASILSADIVAPGTAAVTVVNPPPAAAASNVVFFEVTTASSSIALRAPAAFGTGSGPVSVAVGDFNGDGKLDLAVVNTNSNNVSILLGNGDGTFRSHVDYPTGGAPSWVATGDFNGDGRLDLAITNQSSPGSVSILLGRGDGTFEPAIEFTTGPEPNSLAVGDLNGDGKLDLVVANAGPPIPSEISVLLGNGDGTFQPPVYYNTGSPTGPAFVALGDFNHDGKLDLAVANFYCGTPCGNIAVLLGNGDGTFQPAVNYDVGAQPISIAVGDFNHDGKLDLAVANVSSSDVSVLLGNGDGTFKPAVNYSTPNDAVSVAVGDFNGDGNPDLVVASHYSDNISVFLGNGDGTFQAAVNYSAGSDPNSVAVGDFNNDGRLDVAVADSGSTTVSILLQSPTVSLSKTSLLYASQLVGTSSASQMVTLYNSSSALTLNISSIVITGTNVTDFGQTHTCGASLRPGASCTIKVTFSPSHVGPRTAFVTITDNAAVSPQQIALSGTGVMSGPNATLSTASIAFGTQLVNTTSPAQSVTLTNNGTAMLAIASIVTNGDFGQTNTCGSSLAILASCTISVTFAPKQQGNRAGTLSVRDSAPGSLQTVSLNGTGTVGVQLNPNSLNFGYHKVGTVHTLSTTLTTSSSLSIAGITITGADTDEFSETNTCGASVGAGKSCTITVTFTPKEIGVDSAAISIRDNGSGSPQSVPLAGLGCIPFQRCN